MPAPRNHTGGPPSPPSTLKLDRIGRKLLSKGKPAKCFLTRVKILGLGYRYSNSNRGLSVEKLLMVQRDHILYSPPPPPSAVEPGSVYKCTDEEMCFGLKAAGWQKFPPLVVSNSKLCFYPYFPPSCRRPHRPCWMGNYIKCLIEGSASKCYAEFSQCIGIELGKCKNLFV